MAKGLKTPEYFCPYSVALKDPSKTLLYKETERGCDCALIYFATVFLPLMIPNDRALVALFCLPYLNPRVSECAGETELLCQILSH